MTKDRITLLVEDDPADENLTLRAFRRSKIATEEVVGSRRAGRVLRVH